MRMVVKVVVVKVKNVCLFIIVCNLQFRHKATWSWQFRTRMIRELNTSIAKV